MTSLELFFYSSLFVPVNPLARSLKGFIKLFILSLEDDGADEDDGDCNDLSTINQLNVAGIGSTSPCMPTTLIFNVWIWNVDKSLMVILISYVHPTMLRVICNILWSTSNMYEISLYIVSSINYTDSIIKIISYIYNIILEPYATPNG